jgi:hypothetical protein
MSGVCEATNVIDRDVRSRAIRRRRRNHGPGPLRRAAQPPKQVLGISDRRGKPDALNVRARQFPDSFDYGKQVPTSVIPGKCVNLVHDRGFEAPEKISSVSPARDEQGFETLRCREQ